MTAASVSSGGHDDGPAREWRETLAAALINQGIYWGGDEPGIADALLPVVAGIVAGELRAAADGLHVERAQGYLKGVLQQTAAELRARADEIDRTFSGSSIQRTIRHLITSALSGRDDHTEEAGR